MSPLLIIMGLPLLAALGLAAVPADRRSVFRWTTILATLGSAIAAVFVFQSFNGGLVTDPAAAYIAFDDQLTVRVPWVESLKIYFHLGVDGMGAVMVLMGSLVAFAAACSAGEIKSREKEFAILLLLMTGGILGAFMALDIFLMYFLHELALVPTFIMIGVWGRGEDRDYAAYKITLYLGLGSLIALAGVILLYLSHGTSDLKEIFESGATLDAGRQSLIFALLMFGLGILVSLWPFHTWAPLGYGAAPSATAMMHAGVIKKFGLFMLIRVALPLLPEGAAEWMPVLAWLCLGNLLYCGLVAMRQKDLNQLLGNSSVAHMGFVFLGIASLTTIGLNGAVMVMVAHGRLAALAFGLSGHLYTHTRTLEMDKVTGLLRIMPFWGTALMMALFAGCGLPGFANFVGELTVFFGAWEVSALESSTDHPLAGHQLQFRVITILGVWGALVIGAVYMLRAIRQLLHGKRPELAAAAPDITGWRRVPFAVLLGVLLAFGFFPGLITEKITQATRAIATLALPADTTK